jgi:hypothetical protein
MTGRNRTGAQSHGPLRWVEAIGGSQLGSSEKLVLYALVKFIDWNTGEAHPSIGHISRRASLSAKGVRRILNRLGTQGVVTMLSPSRGGRDASGRGITNYIRVELGVLERGANADSRSALAPANSDSGFREPGPPVPSTRTGAPNNTDSGSDEHSIEQASEPTTTTTTMPVVVEVGARAGRLEEAGLNAAAARQFAANPEITDDLMAFVIRESRKPGVEHPGKLIASLLNREPSTLDGWAAFKASQERKHAADAKKRHAERRDRYGMILTYAHGVDAQHVEDAQKRLSLIKAIWPSLDALADSGPFTNDELFAEPFDAKARFNRLVSAARARQAMREEPSTQEARP